MRLSSVKLREVAREAAAGESIESVRSVSIGPMSITTLSGAGLIEQLIRGICNGAPTQHVVTANAQFYLLAERNLQFQECLAEADYICADGLPIVRMCHWMGAREVERITGIDLIPSLCEQAASLGLPVYFLGGEPGSAAATASQLMDRYPGLLVCGVGCPPRGFENSPRVLREILASIEAANPAIIFVAFGAPKQEFFIRQHIKAMGIPVAIGVGGSFEVISGMRRRAPQWAQTAGMEWIFRLAQEPRRLAKRYFIGNSVFSYYALRFLFSEEALEMRNAVGAEQRDSDESSAERKREIG